MGFTRGTLMLLEEALGTLRGSRNQTSFGVAFEGINIGGT